MFYDKIPITDILRKIALKRRFFSSGIAVDIDGTCADTHTYWVEHLCDQFGYPEDLSTPKDLENRYGCYRNVPVWKDNPEAIAWIEEQVYSRQTHLVLPMVENANVILTDIHLQWMPVAVYLTARPASVYNETKIWLKENKFPDAEIIMRPSQAKNFDSRKWKVEILSQLYPEVCGLIDDDLLQIQSFPPDYEGTIFYFGQDKSPRENSKIIPCPDWQSVRDNIEEFVNSEESQNSSSEV